jgi:hypothetical protein
MLLFLTKEIMMNKLIKLDINNETSEWMVFSTKWAIFQLYHGIRYFLDEMMMLY